MKFAYRWEPRWPAFAVGFYRGARKSQYRSFTLIVWAMVFEITWGQS